MFILLLSALFAAPRYCAGFPPCSAGSTAALPVYLLAEVPPFHLAAGSVRSKRLL